MNRNNPTEMSTSELLEAIDGAERVLTALRDELSTRQDRAGAICGNHWGKHICKLKPGHPGNHAMGFITWRR